MSLHLPVRVAAAECRVKVTRTHRSVALSNCRGEKVELCSSAHPALRSCRMQFDVEGAQLTADQDWLFVWYRSAEERGPMWMDVFKMSTRERTAHFHPGLGGEFVWSGEDILLTTGCGTNCIRALLFNRAGDELLNLVGSAVFVSPDQRALVLSDQPHLEWEPGQPRKLSVCLLRLDARRGRLLHYEVPAAATFAGTDPEDVSWTATEVKLALKWSQSGVERTARFSFPREAAPGSAEETCPTGISPGR